jgi:tetratricopeptide (TPR) repeat protein
MERIHARIRALEPDTFPALKVAEADYFRSAERYAEARQAYTEALALDPTRVAAYTGRAYLAMAEANAEGMSTEQRRAKLGEARTDLEAARGVDPESSDVTWGFIWLANAGREFKEAIAYGIQLIGRNPQWETICRLRCADFQRELNDFEGAEAGLRRVFELEPAQPELAGALNALGEDAYRGRGLVSTRDLKTTQRGGLSRESFALPRQGAAGGPARDGFARSPGGARNRRPARSRGFRLSDAPGRNPA